MDGLRRQDANNVVHADQDAAARHRWHADPDRARADHLAITEDSRRHVRTHGGDDIVTPIA